MDAESDLLQIFVTEHADQTLVTLRGDLDLATQGLLRTCALDLLVAGRTNLVFDLSELTFMDSTGLGALIGIRRRAHGLKGSMVLVCPTSTVMDLFTITGLDKVFDIRPDLDPVLSTP